MTHLKYRHGLMPSRQASGILSVLLTVFLVAGCSTQQRGANPGNMPSQLIVQTSDHYGTQRQAGGESARPFRTVEPEIQYENESHSDLNRSTGGSSSQPRIQPVSSPGRIPPSEDGPRTMLSFVDADLPGVIQALARFTGQNFVTDPRVKGQLTLVSEEPVTPDQAYNMLLAALRMQGFAVVEVDGVNRVLPEADAKLQGMPVFQGQGVSSPRGDLATRVFQLRYENAASLVPVLRPMIAPNNTINAYPANNTLIITDYTDNLDRIAAVIESIDTPNSFSTDVIPIRHGLALDVAALASQMLRSDGPSGNQTMVLADTRSNSVLIRASSPDRLAAARKLVRRIDSTDTREGNLNVVYLRNAQATQLAKVLRGVLSGHASEADESSASSGFDNNRMAGMSSGDPSATREVVASPTGGSIFDSLPTGGSSDSSQSLSGNNLDPYSFTAGGATVQADPATNTLIISAPPPIYRNLRKVIDQLDQRRAQVLVETLIVEVNAENLAEFGIQWMVGGDNLSRNSSSGFIGGANFGGTGINTSGVTTIDSLGAGMSLGVVSGSINVLGNQILNLGLLARAMQSTGDVNVLSTPNLMTMDNEEASIMVGRTVPFVTGQYTTSADGASNPFQTITREDVGLTLRVRPQISEGGTVKLAIYQEVSSIDTAASSPSTGIITRKRALDTDVLIDDGQIIVLGGLLEDTIMDDTSSVPLLGDIPGIGNLFRYDTRRRTKTNLMVFLRPHIIRDARDGASITLDRYNYMRAAQEHLPPRSTWFDPNAEMSQLPALQQNPRNGLLDLRNAPSAPQAPVNSNL